MYCILILYQIFLSLNIYITFASEEHEKLFFLQIIYLNNS